MRKYLNSRGITEDEGVALSKLNKDDLIEFIGELLDPVTTAAATGN